MAFGRCPARLRAVTYPPRDRASAAATASMSSCSTRACPAPTACHALRLAAGGPTSTTASCVRAMAKRAFTRNWLVGGLQVGRRGLAEGAVAGGEADLVAGGQEERLPVQLPADEAGDDLDPLVPVGLRRLDVDDRVGFGLGVGQVQVDRHFLERRVGELGLGRRVLGAGGGGEDQDGQGEANGPHTSLRKGRVRALSPTRWRTQGPCAGHIRARIKQTRRRGDCRPKRVTPPHGE